MRFLAWAISCRQRIYSTKLIATALPSSYLGGPGKARLRVKAVSQSLNIACQVIALDAMSISLDIGLLVVQGGQHKDVHLS